MSNNYVEGIEELVAQRFFQTRFQMPDCYDIESIKTLLVPSARRVGQLVLHYLPFGIIFREGKFIDRSETINFPRAPENGDGGLLLRVSRENFLLRDDVDDDPRFISRQNGTFFFFFFFFLGNSSHWRSPAQGP